MDPDQTLLQQEQSELHSLSMRLLKHSQRQQMQLFFFVVIAALMKNANIVTYFVSNIHFVA